MTQTKLKQDLSDLLAALEADPSNRREVQPKIRAVMDKMREHSIPVPVAVRELERSLSDEDSDDMFDNMPV